MKKSLFAWVLAAGMVLQPGFGAMALETVETEETLESNIEGVSEASVEEEENESEETLHFWLEGEVKPAFSMEESTTAYARNAPAKANAGSVYTEYYGDQLEGNSAEIFSAFVEWYVSQGETGAFQYEVSTPLRMPINISDGQLVQDAYYDAVLDEISAMVQPAYDAFRYDIPLLFWIDTIQYGCSVDVESTSESPTGYMIFIDTYQFEAFEVYDGASGDMGEFLDRVDEAVSTIKSNLDVTSTRYETVKEIHDYIVDTCYYDDRDYDNRNIYSPGPVFLGDGGVVCEGYSEAFKILCDEFDIPCSDVSGQGVTGSSSGPHMWNYVQMNDGLWYLVDSTWDDQGSEINYNYFLAGKNSEGYNDLVGNEHVEEGDLSSTGYMTFAFPVLNDEAYEVPEEKPEAITGLKASSAGKRKVTLQWDEVFGADGYLVYAQKDGTYGYVGVQTKVTSYTDTKALDNDYNYYWVFPYVKNSEGKMITGDCQKYVYAKGVCPAVTNLKASSVNGGVKLTWSASKDAVGYLIYGKTKEGEYGYRGMTTKGTTFTDKKASNTEYTFYWVFPYHENEDGKMIVGLTAPYTYGKAK